MNTLLTLPQLKASFLQPIPSAQVLLVAGGRPPASTWLQKAACGREIWCADRGIEACQQAGIRPLRLIGDGDSASRGAWDWGESLGIQVDRFSPQKDLTDTQLALQKIGGAHPNALILMTGVWGGRFDHAFSNIFSLAGACRQGSRGCAADENEVLLLLNGSDEVVVDTHSRPAAISLLPLSPVCRGVSISGVHWPLDQVVLKSALPYAISNELSPTGHSFKAAVETGCLGVYLQWH